MQRAADYMNVKYGEGTVSLRMEDSYYNMRQQIEPHYFLIENVLKVYEKLDIEPKIQQFEEVQTAHAYPLWDCHARTLEQEDITSTDILNMCACSLWRNVCRC